MDSAVYFCCVFPAGNGVMLASRLRLCECLQAGGDVLGSPSLLAGAGTSGELPPARHRHIPWIQQDSRSQGDTTVSGPPAS